MHDFVDKAEFVCDMLFSLKSYTIYDMQCKITSTNCNFPDWIGSKEACLYLASPATVAASMLNGKITDPRPYL